jgi:catechol 2,3-dioxygenase-like lactoylglutathione lyase family enzyme
MAWQEFPHRIEVRVRKEMKVNVEKISAITLRVADMPRSLQFYKHVLGMEVLYGGEQSGFSSMRAKSTTDMILNLEEGGAATKWGRLIFYVPDVDEFATYLKSKGFRPEDPRDASWGERYFHMYDPDGHEVSFARPLR